MGGNTTTAEVAFVSTDLTTDASGVGGMYLYVDAGRIMQARGFANNYQLYRIKSFQVDYVPVVGATNAGSLSWSYVDNPEIISRVVRGIYPGPDYINLVKIGPKNRVKHTSIWQPLSGGMPATMSNRRRWYSVDAADQITDNYESIDRTCQALMVARWSGPAMTNVGYFTVRAQIEFKDYVHSPLSVPTLQAPGRQYQDADGRWWEEDDNGAHTIPAPGMTVRQVPITETADL